MQQKSKLQRQSKGPSAKAEATQKTRYSRQEESTAESQESFGTRSGEKKTAVAVTRKLTGSLQLVPDETWEAFQSWVNDVAVAWEKSLPPAERRAAKRRVKQCLPLWTSLMWAMLPKKK